MRIEGFPPVNYTAPTAPKTPATIGPADSPAEGFGDQIKNAIDQVNTLQKQADATVTANPEDTYKSVIAMERALLSLDYTLQVRNKVLDAYQEIMKTQL